MFILIRQAKNKEGGVKKPDFTVYPDRAEEFEVCYNQAGKLQAGCGAYRFCCLHKLSAAAVFTIQFMQYFVAAYKYVEPNGNSGILTPVTPNHSLLLILPVLQKLSNKIERIFIVQGENLSQCIQRIFNIGGGDLFNLFHHPDFLQRLLKFREGCELRGG